MVTKTHDTWYCWYLRRWEDAGRSDHVKSADAYDDGNINDENSIEYKSMEYLKECQVDVDDFNNHCQKEVKKEDD